MKAANVNVQIEVEHDRSIMIVLGRPTDAILLRWQDAFHLADVLALAIADARNELDLIDPPTIVREQEQIRLGIHAGLVSLVFAHTDRVRYSWRSAELLLQALRIKAQDLQYAEREIALPTFRRNGKLTPLRRLLR